MTKTPNDPGTILLVDDTPANLELLGAMLAARGYRVRKSPSGRIALESARLMPPDLILLDIKMPQMNGYEVCRALKADAATRDIPIIFISALQETDGKVEAFRAGGVDFVTKPFQAEEVVARVGTHLAIARLHRELATAREEAEAANRAKSAFLANMSHELRTPLNAILGFAQIMRLKRARNGQEHDDIAAIEGGGKYLLALIDDILDLAKVEAGRFEIFPEVWPTRPFFDDIAASFHCRAEAKGILFHADVDPRLPAALHGDAKRLRQICMNLLGNAVKFTERGRVRLDAHHAEGRLVIEVQDTGIGIASEDVAHIFEPFGQVGKGDTGRQGTGLGLSITHKLVDLMGGTIDVESVLGEGTRFSVQLPMPAVSTLEEAGAGRDGPDPVAYVRRAGQAPVRLLICDRLEQNREVLRRLLAPLGFETREAADLRACRDLVVREAPDLVLTELELELGGAGDEPFPAWARETRALGKPPIVAVSGNAFAQDRERALAAGYSDYLTKPILFPDLVACLGRLLDLVWQYPIPPQSEAVVFTREEVARIGDYFATGRIGELQQYLDALAATYGGAPEVRRLRDLAYGYEIVALKKAIEGLTGAGLGTGDA